MRRLVFGWTARADLTELAHYIARESGSGEVARRFVASVRQQCAHMAGLPGVLGRGRPELAEGLRSSVFGNYLVFFRYGPSTFRVVRIVEGHRDLPQHVGAGREGE